MRLFKFVFDGRLPLTSALARRCSPPRRTASAPAVGNSSGEGAFEQARNFQPTASEAGLSETSTGKGDINPHSTPDARAAQAMEAYGRMGIFGDANVRRPRACSQQLVGTRGLGGLGVRGGA